MTTEKSHWPLSILGILVSILNLFFPLALVRILPPESVGHYKVFFLYLAIVPLFSMTAGITNGLFHWSGHVDKRERAFRASWTLILSAALFLLAVGSALQPQIAQWTGWSGDEAWLYVWGAFVTVLASFYEDSQVAAGAIWRGALFSSGFEFSRVLAMFVGAWIFRDIRAVFIAHVGMLTLKSAVGISLGLIKGYQRPLWNQATFSAVARYALPVSAASALTILTNYADQLVLSQTLAKAEFAVYTVCCLTVPPLLIFEQSVNRVFIPRISREFAENRASRAMVLFRDSISELSWMIIPAAFAICLFAKPIILLLFTQKYLGGLNFMRVAGLGYLTLIFPFDSIARARGNGTWILRQLAIFSALMVVLAYFLAKDFGALAVLLGFNAVNFSMRLSAIVGLRWRERWSLRQMLPWRDWSRYLGVTAIACVGGWSLHTLTGGGIRWLLVGGTLYSLIYALGTTGLFLRRRAESEPRARVLYLTQFLGLGGLERMILNLSSELKEQGKYDPVVVVYDDMQGGVGLHGEFELRGVPVVTLSKTGGFSVRAVAKIVREILRRRILVIHSHDLGALIYAVFAKWATLGGVRIVHTQHSFIHLEKHPRYRQYERFFSMFVDQLSTVSEGLQKQYSTVGIEPARVAVVPNGVEFPKAAVLERPELLSLRKKQLDSPEVAAEPEASSRLHALRESVWVLCMARVHPKKGQEHVAELWRALPESARKKAALIFVGQETFQGALARLREKIAGLPDRDRVVYAGFTMKPGPWLQAADIAVSGSEFEGMPLGPIESVGAGMQVLVSAIEGHSMLPLAIPRFSLENPATGAADLAQMIEKAAGLPRAVREALWSSGRQAREQFGIAAMAQRYAEFYHSVGK